MRPNRPIVAVTALALFCVLTWLMTSWSPVSLLDTEVSEAARRFGAARPGWVTAMRVITYAGDGAVMIVTAVVLGVVLLAKRRYRDVVVLAIAALAARGALMIVQPAIGRDRPVDGFVYVGLPAFPSGHTVQSGTVALLSVLLLWRWLPQRWRPIAVVAAAAWTGLVGLSRVALLAHWPSDVLGGWLLVIGVVLAAVEIVDRAGGWWRTRRRPPRTHPVPGGGGPPAASHRAASPSR